jgi:hypothetical protein
MPPADASSADRVKLTRDGDVIAVTIDNELFTAYHYADADRPYFYPVIGPTGENVTRHWPMKDGVGEEQDHPHQRSLWFTHGDVNGHDFWNEGKGPRIIQTSIELESGADKGVLTTTSEWQTKEGEIVCTDKRVHTFRATKDGPVMDWQVTIIASHGNVVLGDSKEGTMAIRIAPTLRLTGEVAAGHIVNSEGLRDDDTWGNRAKWVDYSGPLSGKPIGIALFDHPDNPRYPTWWHVRGYGLFAANPFGISSFDKKPEGAGNMEVKDGESVTFQYRLYMHEGDETAGKVEEQYNLYVS